MDIALIRHGQTDWNLAGRVQGRTDIPLNDTGREQARAAAVAVLADGGPWDVVVSSPLSRARETAEIMAAGLGLQMGGTFESLIEQNFGAAEGLTVAEFAERWPLRDFPDGERDDDVGVRGLGALDEIALRFAGARVLAVSHGSFIRDTIAALSGHAPLALPRIENATLSHLRRGDPHWQVLTMGGVPFERAVPVG